MICFENSRDIHLSLLSADGAGSVPAIDGLQTVARVDGDRRGQLLGTCGLKYPCDSAERTRVAQTPKAAQQCLGALLDRVEIPVAVAESLTGGELSARVASTPGAGAWFRGGLVAYSSEVKHDVLGVPPGPVVSEAAATAMARGVCRLLGAAVAIAVTGVGGPDPQDDQSPGTVWLALCHDGLVVTRLMKFDGTPEEIVDATCSDALEWLVEYFEERAGAA
jgi:nicotinamide-nucleotide amidase